MTYQQSQPLSKNERILAALSGFGPFDPFSIHRLIIAGVDDEAIKRAVSLGHIKQSETVTINGHPAFQKGPNWYEL